MSTNIVNKLAETITGLSDREFLVYKAALKRPQSTASQLAEETGLPRTSVYHTVSLLQEQNLLTEEKLNSGRTCYAAAVPKALVKQAKERVRVAEEGLQEIRKLAESLEKIAGKGSDDVLVKVLHGVEGLWTLVEDVLYTKSDSYWLTATKLPFSKMLSEKDYFRRITHRRKRMKLTKSFIIADDSAFSRKLVRQGDLDFREVKILPNTRLNGSIIIYGRKIGLVSFDSKNPKTLIVESKQLNNLLLSLFQIIWPTIS